MRKRVKQRGLSFHFLAGILSVSGILNAVTIFGFVQNVDDQGNGAHWQFQTAQAPTNSLNPATRAIRFYLASEAYSAGNREAELNSIRAAFDQWQSIPLTRIRFEDAGLVPNNFDINTADGTNIVFWAKNSPFVNGGRDNISGTLALTYHRVTSDNIIVESDIVLNGLQTDWFTDFSDSNNPGQFIESSVLHEIGHLLGLEHSPVGGATMFARSATGVGTQAGLSLDEIAAGRTIYSATESNFAGLFGRVLMNTAPVFGAALFLEDTAGNIQQGTVSRDDGSFGFTALIAGDYTLRVVPLDPLSANSLGRLVTGSDIAPAYTGAETDFQPKLTAVSLQPTQTNHIDLQLIPTSTPPFRISRLVTPAADPQDFRAINAPIQLPQGAHNIFVGVCSTNLPSANANLSISGNDISMGPTFSHLGAFASAGVTLNLLYATITINSNAIPGLRSFVVFNGTNASYANGFLEILPPAPDFNFDGLDDRFQRANFSLFTSLEASPGFDADGDQQDNLAEFLSGTDPRDPASVLKIERVSKGANYMEVQWQSEPGRIYQVVATNFVDSTIWTAAGANVMATGTSTVWTDGSPPQGKRFYRIELVK